MLYLGGAGFVNILFIVGERGCILAGSVLREIAWGGTFEQPAAQIWAEHKWPGSFVVRTPNTADLDFVVVSAEHKLLAAVEVKVRRNASGDFDTTMMRDRKHDAGRFTRAYYGVPAYALIVFTDTVAACRLWEPPDVAAEVTRRDRGSSAAHVFYSKDKLEYFPELLSPILTAAGITPAA